MNRHLQKIGLGISVFLALLICFTLFYNIKQWHQDWLLSHQTILPPTLVSPQPTINLAIIPTAHLFGKSLTKISELPISSLQLQVTGIVKVSNENPNDSKVYISTSGQPSKIYRLGDTITTDVKIYNITPDAVILENNGRFEKIPLKREKLQFKPFIKKE